MTETGVEQDQNELMVNQLSRAVFAEFIFTEEEREQFMTEINQHPFVFGQVKVKNHFDYLSESSNLTAQTPEAIKLMGFLQARMMGYDYQTAAIDRVEISAQGEKNRYLIGNREKATPFAYGMKIHLNVDLFNPRIFQVIKTVADVCRACNWKIVEFDGLAGADKTITIYPPADGDKNYGVVADANFRTAVQLARQLDETLVVAGIQAGKRRQFSKTDILVGRSGLVSMRYGQCGITGKSVAPLILKDYVDDREKTFSQNFPSPELLREFLLVAKQESLM